MHNHFFKRTKNALIESINDISNALNLLYQNPSSFWDLSISTTDKSTKSYLATVYNVNQSIINTLNTMKNDIYEGKINNARQYFESDLTTVDVIVSIHSQYSNDDHSILITSTDKLKEKIMWQLDQLYSDITHFPEDLATNVKMRPRVVSVVSLDYYQMIYLALAHAHIQIQNIQLVESLINLSETTKTD